MKDENVICVFDSVNLCQNLRFIKALKQHCTDAEQTWEEIKWKHLKYFQHDQICASVGCTAQASGKRSRLVKPERGADGVWYLLISPECHSSQEKCRWGDKGFPQWTLSTVMERQHSVTSRANGDRTTYKAGKPIPQNTERNGQTYQVFCVSVWTLSCTSLWIFQCSESHVWTYISQDLSVINTSYCNIRIITAYVLEAWNSCSEHSV